MTTNPILDPENLTASNNTIMDTSIITNENPALDNGGAMDNDAAIENEPTSPKIPGGNRKKTTHLKSDDYIRILTLSRDAGLPARQISERTGFTINQVRRVIREGAAGPKSRSGRPPLMTEEDAQELIAFVTASRENRRMNYAKLSEVFKEGRFTENMIRTTLHNHGFKRYIARVAPAVKHETTTSRSSTNRRSTRQPLVKMEELDNSTIAKSPQSQMSVKSEEP